MATGGEALEIYILEGTRYNISNAVETFGDLTSALGEISVEVGDKSTEIKKVVERVQILMANHYETIKGESKLREKVRGLRTQIRKRMTEIQTRILEIVELDPRGDESIPKTRIFNNETVGLQSVSLDETALTLILGKDMSDEDLKRDRVESKKTRMSKPYIGQSHTMDRGNSYSRGRNHPGIVNVCL